LSKRLRAILDLIKNCHTLADIGADHGYLPIEACRLDICQKAIACDINKAPLEVANANIHDTGLSDRIETRLGDGLNPLNNDEADCIVISGMGGLRIWNILDNGENKAKFASKLILQPQHDLEVLRRRLHSTGYKIHDEKLVLEDSHFYVILVASYTDEIGEWTAQEYFLGKYLCQSPYFLEYLLEQKEKIERYFSSIKDAATRKQAEQRLEWLNNYQKK